MILDIDTTDLYVVAIDTADPDDLSGGGHDYAYLGRRGGSAPDLRGAIRATVEGAVLPANAFALTIDTETGRYRVTFDPTTIKED